MGSLSGRGRGALAGVQWRKQIGHCEPQGIRNADEVQHREVTMALLNLNDVRRT